MKLNAKLLIGACLLVAAACSKDDGWPMESSGETRVAYISLSSGEDGVKSSLESDWTVKWQPGDEILYYTGRWTSGTSTAMTADSSCKVAAASTSEKVTVQYKDGDNRVTFLTKGKSVGNVTVGSLNSLTIAGAVPSSQDGTFASTYIAACEGNLIALTSTTTANLTMTPVQSYVRFKLEDLTDGGKVVNRITLTGKVLSGTTLTAANICGDLTVGITENGTAIHTVSSAATASGSTITIDRTKTKFTTTEYIYVAVLPAEYSEFTITLYNGTTKVSGIAVKPTTSGTIMDATMGKTVDLGSIADTKKHIAFQSATMYPSKVAITKDRTTKDLWLKIEPEDFDGTVTWTSSSTTKATVEATGTKVTYEGMKCIRTTVTNKTSSYGSQGTVTITATIKDLTDNSTRTKTCEIELGDWLDIGIKNSDGKRILFARHVVYYNGTSWSLYSNSETAENVTTDCKYIRFAWGEVKTAPTTTPGNVNGGALYFAWALDSGETVNLTTAQYSKYTSTDKLPHLQRKTGEFSSSHNTVDDPCSRWGGENVFSPTVNDAMALHNGMTLTSHTGYKKLTGKAPGYTDCWMTITSRSLCEGTNSSAYYSGTYGFWLGEYDFGFSGMAFYYDPSLGVAGKTRNRRGVYRPVKYANP